LEVTPEVPLDSGRTDPLAPAKATPVDAIQVLLINHVLETLTRLTFC
jgi:hypothetical protein